LVTHHLRGGPALTVEAGPADLRVINEIWIARCYAGDGRIVPRAGWTVVDIGANKGIFAAWVLHQAAAKIHCYEPDPANYACLEQNVGRHAETVRAAVGSWSGRVTLYQVPQRRALSCIVPGRLQARGTDTEPVEVPIVSFQDVARRIGPIDLLKVDIEGAEYDLILNSPDESFASVQRIALEYDVVHPVNPEIKGRDVADRLRALRFEVDEGSDGVWTGARIMTAVRTDAT